MTIGLDGNILLALAYFQMRNVEALCLFVNKRSKSTSAADKNAHVIMELSVIQKMFKKSTCCEKSTCFKKSQLA